MSVRYVKYQKSIKKVSHTIKKVSWSSVGKILVGKKVSGGSVRKIFGVQKSMRGCLRN